MRCAQQQTSWEDEREGPAARAVRTLEQQVAAAAEEATTGSVENVPGEQRQHGR